MEKLLTPRDVMQITQSGRTTVYALFNRRDFPAVQIGKRKFVAEEDFRAWLAQGGTEKRDD